MRKINTALKGQVVVFSGFDGNEYTAHVESVRKGVAKLLYQVNSPEGKKWVNAYLQDGARIR